jgi:1,4-dihydroxy-2-naphthoate octaprenyltransferase
MIILACLAAYVALTVAYFVHQVHKDFGYVTFGDTLMFILLGWAMFPVDVVRENWDAVLLGKKPK